MNCSKIIRLYSTYACTVLVGKAQKYFLYDFMKMYAAWKGLSFYLIIFLRSFKFASSFHTYHSSKIRSSYFWYDNNHYFIIIFQFIKPSVSNAFVSIIETSSWLNWSYRFGDSTWSTSFISSASSRMSLRASSTSFVRRRSGVCAISGGSNTQNMSNSGIYQQ